MGVARWVTRDAPTLLYVQVLRRLLRLLAADLSEAELEATAEEEWEADRKGQDTISRELFQDALFELLDHWTESAPYNPLERAPHVASRPSPQPSDWTISLARTRARGTGIDAVEYAGLGWRLFDAIATPRPPGAFLRACPAGVHTAPPSPRARSRGGGVRIWIAFRRDVWLRWNAH